MPSPVAQVPAADSASALAHFEESFRFETDCADVHLGLAHAPDFVLIDVRGAAAFAAAHVPGAINIPHAKIMASRLAQYAPGTLFVVYCAGPHCNGAARAAARLARLGLPVKVMAGGMTGWRDEHFPLTHGACAATATTA